MWYFSLILLCLIRKTAGEEENLKQRNNVNFKKLSSNVNFANKIISIFILMFLLLEERHSCFLTNVGPNLN